MNKIITERFEDHLAVAKAVMESDLLAKLDTVAEVVKAALQKGNKVLFCGNGGSAADSQHLAAELVGRYKINRPAMNSISLTVDTSNLTVASLSSLVTSNDLLPEFAVVSVTEI